MSTIAENPAALTGDALSESLPAPGGAGVSVARSFRRHRLLAIFAAVLVLGAGLPIAWIKGAARYSATAVVFVSPHFVANLQGSREVDQKSDVQYHEYVQQNARTINRFDIVEESLKKMGSRSDVWIKPDESLKHAAERLQAALDVEPVADTYQIAVTLENTRPEGLAELVNTVVAVYLDKAKTEEFYASDERVKSLMQDRAGIQNEVQEKQARRLAIAQDLAVSSFTENFVNPYDRLLVGAKEALAVARRQNIEADAQVAALDEKQRQGGSNALRAIAEGEALKDVSLTALDSNQSLRRTQLLTAVSGLSPDHPGRRAAERELAELDAQRKAVYDRLVGASSQGLLDQRRADAYKASRVEQKLKAEVDQQTAQASWFTKNYQEGMQLGIEIEQARKRIDGIQQRIDFLSLEKDAPGFVRMFSSARVPDQPTKGGRRKLFGLVLVAALVFGLAIPVAADALDPGVHTPRDLETALGFAPVAWLLDKRAAGPDFANEQLMRFASRIVQDQQASGSRIFALTAAKAGAGTSSLVMETAAAVTRLGISALAVEANAYNGDSRYSAKTSKGLRFVLTGSQKVEAAIVPGQSGMPDYIPVGGPQDEKNLPDIQKLIEVLRGSADAYSVVLIDLPPIMASVDAEFIARGSDVTVLVVEADTTTREEVKRAAACLSRIKVPAVSAILTKVAVDAGDGFARSARQEFISGSGSTAKGWLARKLWS